MFMVENKFIYGRKSEIQTILNHYKSPTSSMLAVVGRRRVGKTYLIRKVLEGVIDFEMTGYQHGSKKDQLQNFLLTLSKFTNTSIVTQPPKTWLEAFHQLRIYLSEKKGKKKKVIFLDELPWMNTPKAGFVESLAHFWNDWASENNVLLIICGSAAAWMLKNVVHNKGGLHNRITQTIFLEPFDLKDTKAMLDGLKIKATPHQVIELNMVLGGVPYYLSLLQREKSIAQNIEQLLFEKNGNLVKEFDNLFQSLFDNAGSHIHVIDLLSSKWKGLTRKEIADEYKGKDGGSLTLVLDELILSGFVAKYIPFQKTKKDTLYRICDPYILFYKRFLSKKALKSSYAGIMNTPSYRSWCGYAFENICLNHTALIKDKIGIARIESVESSFYAPGSKDQDGFQIDLVIDRADGIINICEMKYYNAPFTIDNKYYTELQLRIENFRKISKTQKAIQLVFISSLGLLPNAYSHEIVDIDIAFQDALQE